MTKEAAVYFHRFQPKPEGFDFPLFVNSTLVKGKGIGK
jgi:hypothetical protein